MPYIYKICDLRNNMCVVGKTFRGKKGYFTGSKIIKNIIKKYGKKNSNSFLKREVLVRGDFSEALLNELEKHYIRLLNTRWPNGYNLTDGGDGKVGTGGWHHTEEWKKANSERNKGKKLPKQRIIELTKIRSEKWKDPIFRERTIASIKRGRNKPESLKKTSDTHRGKKLSEETINKIKHNWFKKGHVSHNTGMSLTEEHKQKLKESWRKNKKDRLKSQNISGLNNGEKRAIKIDQYTKDGVFVKSWNSIHEAGSSLGINGSSISRVSRNDGLKSAGGFLWKINNG